MTARVSVEVMPGLSAPQALRDGVGVAVRMITFFFPLQGQAHASEWI